MLMHNGLLGVTFCPPVHLFVSLGLDQNLLEKKIWTGKNSYLWNHLPYSLDILYEDDLTCYLRFV